MARPAGTRSIALAWNICSPDIAPLIEAVRATPSIQVIEGYAAEALLTEDGAVAGLQLRKVGDAMAKPVTIA